MYNCKQNHILGTFTTVATLPVDVYNLLKPALISLTSEIEFNLKKKKNVKGTNRFLQITNKYEVMREEKCGNKVIMN